MSKWTAMPVKNDDYISSLHFTYKLNTLLGWLEQLVQLKKWEIESFEGQSEHVCIGLKEEEWPRQSPPPLHEALFLLIVHMH